MTFQSNRKQFTLQRETSAYHLPAEFLFESHLEKYIP